MNEYEKVYDQSTLVDGELSGFKRLFIFYHGRISTYVMMILNKLSSFSNSDTSHFSLVSEKLSFQIRTVEDITFFTE